MKVNANGDDRRIKSVRQERQEHAPPQQNGDQVASQELLAAIAHRHALRAGAPPTLHTM